MPSTATRNPSHSLAPMHHPTITHLMQLAYALVPTAASPNPDAYDAAAQTLEDALCRALHLTPPYSGALVPASLPLTTPVTLHPDLVQMMDDMAGLLPPLPSQEL